MQRYDDDMFLLIEGERRWTVAKKLGLKEIPATIIGRLDEHDQVVTMFHVHAQRKGCTLYDGVSTIVFGAPELAGRYVALTFFVPP